MSYLTDDLKQTASYWAKGSTFDNYGNPTWDTPVLLPCRWEETTEKIVGAQGEEIMTRAVIFLDTDVTIGSYLLLGEFGSGETDPLVLSSAFEILDFKKIPELGGSDFERTARV